MTLLDDATILITGGTGFVGSHLASKLAAISSCKLHLFNFEPIKNNPSLSDTEYTFHSADITNKTQIAQKLALIRPDIIFHLAAQSNVHTSFKNADLTWRVNLFGTQNMLEAASRYVPNATFINVGSSDMYGRSFLSDTIVTEQSLLMPLNPYAASKAAADLLAYQYSATSSLKVIRARPFNHSGPGQSNQFVLPAFACQIAEIEAGICPPVLRTGDLTPERDFLHIDDVINAYILLAKNSSTITSGQAFNIASGQPFRVSTLLNKLIQKSSTDIRIEQDPERLRPVEIPHIQGSSNELKAITGWEAKLTMDNLLEDLLGFWRKTVQQQSQ